ncbi:MAG: hypothetical protein US52_C0006G0024 [candidate division WS6 bacterium GW2011_GWA2_37_6]|uniref:Uncharacterized protein n=1 Tax=candidate division WS6 bacterium GW2011_GWA2_37_6 TaxID=1619087 RepID=A0A0G0JHF2_9BACT|nr:MAG: hypothetical protein US52_C0006G0024 [candidate division WS6 bacterium GW2011_GWA2_37_6]
MSENVDGQLSTVMIGLGIALLIIFIASLIMFLISYLNKTELSDQKGWKNFRKPAVGFAIISVVLLGIILIVLLLLEVL